MHAWILCRTPEQGQLRTSSRSADLQMDPRVGSHKGFGFSLGCIGWLLGFWIERPARFRPEPPTCNWPLGADGLASAFRMHQAVAQASLPISGFVCRVSNLKQDAHKPLILRIKTEATKVPLAESQIPRMLQFERNPGVIWFRVPLVRCLFIGQTGGYRGTRVGGFL